MVYNQNRQIIRISNLVPLGQIIRGILIDEHGKFILMSSLPPSFLPFLNMGDDLIGVNTSFVFVWGAGAAVGPGMAGAAMHTFGPDGMPALGVVLCAAFLLLLLRTRSEAPTAR